MCTARLNALASTAALPCIVGCGQLFSPKEAVTTAWASSPTCLATSQATCGLTRAAILCQIPCRDPRLRYVAQCTRCLCTTRALCSAWCGLWAVLLTQKRSRQRVRGSSTLVFLPRRGHVSVGVVALLHPSRRFPLAENRHQRARRPQAKCRHTRAPDPVS